MTWIVENMQSMAHLPASSRASLQWAAEIPLHTESKIALAHAFALASLTCL